ncbi:MAG: creatininase family protein [Ruminococcaceae bacterium]|nr:creatininase family protein [Oscillospiraceae bacterium]
METRWLYTTSENFPALVEASKKTCVIPMGCVEKHGLHLPLGTDCIHSSHIAYEASKLETVCVFPDFVFGDVPGGPAMPAGSISVPVEMEMALLEQLCDQISRNGFEKIIIFNGHGGNNPWLNTFLRNLMNKKKPYVVCVVMIKLQAPHMMAEYLEQNGAGSIPELSPGDERLLADYHEMGMKIGHGGMGETSYLMGICPESVKMDRLGIVSGLSTGETDYLKEAGITVRDGGWNTNYPNAYHGHDPVGCNERIGKAAVRLETERLAHAIKVVKEDKNMLRWHTEFQKGM